MKKHIFLVDDDEAILDIMKIMLEDKGFSTTLISNGRDFFKTINKKTPDLILLDIWLTGVSGIEIIKKLKTKKKYAQIPVIFITANSQGRQLAESNGASGYLAKPFEIDDLIQTVNQALALKERL